MADEIYILTKIKYLKPREEVEKYLSDFVVEYNEWTKSKWMNGTSIISNYAEFHNDHFISHEVYSNGAGGDHHYGTLF